MDQSVPGTFESGKEGTVVALSCEQAHSMLSQYANAALSADLAANMDAHLESCDKCSTELGMLRAEDELLTDALAEIRPDPTVRARVGQLCAEALRHAERVANSLPERGWAFFRWGLATLAVAHFALLSLLVESPDPIGPLGELESLQETGESAASQGIADWFSAMLWSVVEARSATYWINLFLFLLAIFLLIGGRLVATFERWLARRMGGTKNPGPSRLAVLTLEALGICGVLATSALYYTQLTQ